MQTKGSFQTFDKSKHAIWLLTTNESLLATFSSLVSGTRLGCAGKAHAFCQDLTAPHFSPCLRFALDWSLLGGHVLDMSEKSRKEKTRGCCTWYFRGSFSQKDGSKCRMSQLAHIMSVTFPLEQMVNAKIQYEIPKPICLPYFWQYHASELQKNQDYHS